MNEKNKLTETQRKAIKLGINILIIFVLFLGFYKVHEIGKINGKVEFCKQIDKDAILVNFRGIDECWDKERKADYLNQFGDNKGEFEGVLNGLQYNTSG